MRKPKRRAAREILQLEKYLNKRGRKLRPGLKKLLERVRAEEAAERG